jgi:hypothetical protein
MTELFVLLFIQTLGLCQYIEEVYIGRLSDKEEQKEN